MSRLLRAGLGRFKKSKIYACCLGVILLYCIFVCVMQYKTMVKYDLEFGLDSVIFIFMPLVGIVVSVFVSMFTGTEYSDGTIRNKLIVGLPRTSIYLSSYMVCIIGGMILIAGAYCLGTALGLPLFGPPEMPLPKLLLFAVNGMVMGVAYISIFHMVTMLNSSKTNAAVLCILIAFGLLFVAAGVYSSLSQPEYIDQMLKKNGEMVMETVKNPNYLTGVKREIYQNILDFLPSGQAMQITNMNVLHPVRMILYSGVITLVTNAAGIFLFRKKDIK